MEIGRISRRKIMNTYYSIRLDAASLGLACFLRSDPIQVCKIRQTSQKHYLPRVQTKKLLFLKENSIRKSSRTLRQRLEYSTGFRYQPTHTPSSTGRTYRKERFHLPVYTHFSHQQIPAAHPKLISFSLRLSPFIKSGNFA